MSSVGVTVCDRCGCQMKSLEGFIIGEFNFCKKCSPGARKLVLDYVQEIPYEIEIKVIRKTEEKATVIN
jgi:hypothetical protein